MEQYGLSDKITLMGIERELSAIKAILLRQEEILQALLEAIREKAGIKGD